MVRSNLPNCTLIGAACRPCGAKTPKTGTRVKTIPRELPAANHAGKKLRGRRVQPTYYSTFRVQEPSFIGLYSWPWQLI